MSSSANEPASLWVSERRVMEWYEALYGGSDFATLAQGDELPGFEWSAEEYDANADIAGAQARYLKVKIGRALRRMAEALGQ